MTTTSPLKLSCEMCNLRFGSDDEVIEHYCSLPHHIKQSRQNSTSKHQCPVCQNSYETIADYSLHLESEAHSDSLEKLRINRTLLARKKMYQHSTTDQFERFSGYQSTSRSGNSNSQLPPKNQPVSSERTSNYSVATTRGNSISHGTPSNSRITTAAPVYAPWRPPPSVRQPRISTPACLPSNITPPWFPPMMPLTFRLQSKANNYSDDIEVDNFSNAAVTLSTVPQPSPLPMKQTDPTVNQQGEIASSYPRPLFPPASLATATERTAASGSQATASNFSPVRLAPQRRVLLQDPVSLFEPDLPLNIRNLGQSERVRPTTKFTQKKIRQEFIRSKSVERKKKKLVKSNGISNVDENSKTDEAVAEPQKKKKKATLNNNESQTPSCSSIPSRPKEIVFSHVLLQREGDQITPLLPGMVIFRVSRGTCRSWSLRAILCTGKGKQRQTVLLKAMRNLPISVPSGVAEISLPWRGGRLHLKFQSHANLKKFYTILLELREAVPLSDADVLKSQQIETPATTASGISSMAKRKSTSSTISAAALIKKRRLSMKPPSMADRMLADRLTKFRLTTAAANATSTSAANAIRTTLTTASTSHNSSPTTPAAASAKSPRFQLNMNEALRQRTRFLFATAMPGFGATTAASTTAIPGVSSSSSATNPASEMNSTASGRQPKPEQSDAANGSPAGPTSTIANVNQSETNNGAPILALQTLWCICKREEQIRAEQSQLDAEMERLKQELHRVWYRQKELQQQMEECGKRRKALLGELDEQPPPQGQG